MSVSLSNTFDVDRYRTHFPVLNRTIEGRRLVYLDSACTALKSQAVADRLADFYANWGGCGGKRSTHLLSQQVEQWFYEARTAVASFLHADDVNEVVFTSGATAAINLVCQSFPYDKERYKVVITDLEHNAVSLPFIEASKRGDCELIICPTRDGRIDLNHLSSLIDHKTALLAMTHASNVYGGVLPVAEASRIARQKGARVLIDDAQYLSTHTEDVKTLGADFVVFSGHKLGGPFGLGVLWGRENELNRMRPFQVGGGTIKSMEWESQALPVPTYMDAPGRFESGVQNFGGAVGLHEALKLRASMSTTGVREHLSSLIRYSLERLQQFDQLQVLGHPEDLMKGSLISFIAKDENVSPVDFNLYLNHELDARFVAIRVGEHCAHLLHKRLNRGATVRISLGAYNTTSDVETFMDALGAYIREACGG